MRILLVSQEYPPETHWGGIATYMSTLAPALVSAGHDVHVLSVVPGQNRSTVRGPDGVVVHRAPLIRPRAPGRLTGLVDTWGRVSLGWNVAREYKRMDETFDVIEATAWNAEALFLARRRVAPLVVHLFSSAHEILPLLGPLTRDRRWAIALEDALVRRADLLTGTRAQLAKVSTRTSPVTMAMREITCPVLSSPEAPAPFDGPPTVAFIGRFESRKGPDTVVRAFAKVKAEVPEARLVLNGHDTSDNQHRSFADHLRQLAAESGVGDAVTVNERWGDHETVLREMVQSTVCVMPSRWESFGYVAAEASALGRAVVASDIPALAEVVENGRTGLLVPPEDVDGWARALASVLLEPQRAIEMGRAGRELMRQERSPELVARQTVELYREAIAIHAASAV